MGFSSAEKVGEKLSFRWNATYAPTEISDCFLHGSTALEKKRVQDRESSRRYHSLQDVVA
jgi:hypothetical protein